MADKVWQVLSGYRNINQTGSYGRQRHVLLPVGLSQWPRLSVLLSLVLHEAQVAALHRLSQIQLSTIGQVRKFQIQITVTCMRVTRVLHIAHLLPFIHICWQQQKVTHPRCQKWSHVLAPSQWLRLLSLPLVPSISLLRISVHDSFDLIWLLRTGQAWKRLARNWTLLPCAAARQWRQTVRHRDRGDHDSMCCCHWYCTKHRLQRGIVLAGFKCPQSAKSHSSKYTLQ